MKKTKLSILSLFIVSLWAVHAVPPCARFTFTPGFWFTGDAGTNHGIYSETSYNSNDVVTFTYYGPSTNGCTPSVVDCATLRGYLFDGTSWNLAYTTTIQCQSYVKSCAWHLYGSVNPCTSVIVWGGNYSNYCPCPPPAPQQ